MKNYSNKNIDFPTCNVWGELYSKFRKQLMAKLSSYYCLADHEDAVESAFDKLMNKKGKEAYGDKMPKTEEGWFWALYWQSKSYLSHMREHGVVHARYVEEMAKELENVFDPGYAGEFLDDEVYSKALSSALDSFRKDRDISCRNLQIYISATAEKISAKVLAAKFKISEENVYVIKFRVGKLLEKHGKKYFQAAMKKAV
jgi:hypothetical protein